MLSQHNRKIEKKKNNSRKQNPDQLVAFIIKDFVNAKYLQSQKQWKINEMMRRIKFSVIFVILTFHMV